MNRISTTSARTSRLQAVSAAVLVALTALTGAAWMTVTAPDDGPAVITLERVIVEGRHTPELAHADVKRLPRVVVEGRSAADGTPQPADVRVAQAGL